MSEFYPDPIDANNFGELPEEPPENDRLGLGAVLLLIVLIMAMVSTLLWPVLWQSLQEYSQPPTPTPFFLQEA